MAVNHAVAKDLIGFLKRVCNQVGRSRIYPFLDTYRHEGVKRIYSP